MKKLLILLLIIVSVSCKKADAAACGECLTFYFENPQPINDSELSGFPSKFKGIYIDKDSNYVKIEEDRILKEYPWKFKIHKLKLDSLKSECEIVDGKLIANDTKEVFEMIPKGDSIELTQKSIDTIFRFSYNEKAKLIKGQLVLSFRDSILWNIQTIVLEKNILKIKQIYLPKDLIKLDSITAIKGKMLDSTSYLIKPTRREFKSILKIKDFGTNQDYRKVSI